MSFLSLLKALLLKGVDAANGKPAAFDRAYEPDPRASFTSDGARRSAIEQFSELELRNFVVDGTFACALPNDLGDSAIWQGVYTAMCVFRWKYYGTEGARIAMVKASTALAKYLHFGILVRGAMPSALEGKLFVKDESKATAYFTYDGYTFREDASLDSLVGVMFGIAAVKKYGDVEANAPLTSPLNAFAVRFAKDEFRLTNMNGSRTTYGDCSPGFFQAPVRIIAAALPSLLADLHDWHDIAASHASEFATPDTQVPGKMSWVNAHLAILAVTAYIMGSDEPMAGRRQALDGLDGLVAKYSDAGNSFLVAMANLIGRKTSIIQTANAAKILGEFPLGAKLKSVNSSGEASQPLPPWKRPPFDVAWQRSPYSLGGATENDLCRLDYLVAHYATLMVGA